MQFACNGGRRKLRNPNPKPFTIDNRFIRGHLKHCQTCTYFCRKSNVEIRRNKRYIDCISVSIDVACRDTKIG